MTVPHLASRVLLDRSYAIALLSPADLYHASALEIERVLRETRTSYFITRAVMLEIGNGLAAPSSRQHAVRFLALISNDPQAQIVEVTEGSYDRALALYQRRIDKAWGLVDCLSFVTMTELGLGDALTTDRNFEQAGFRAVLRGS
jgi:predicted nucleic acid-binding protein